MHELTLCRSLVDTLVEQAGAHGFARVVRVRLEIGPLGHVDADAVAFGFDVVSRGTLAEGAVLDVVRPAGAMRCAACAAEVEMAFEAGPCPSCGADELVVAGGDAMRVTELEVA